MSTLENVWENRSAGVKVVRESLLLWLSEGEDVGQLLEEKKGSYCEKLKCWLLDYRNLSYSSCPFDSSGRWMNVEGEFAVFKPEPGLQISTTFMELKDGRALCGVEAGDCGWMVYVEGMTEEQMERLEPGQTVVVKLNLVAIELSGKLLLMGCRIFEDNNNAVTVEEGGDSVQGEEVRRSYVQAEVGVEEEQEVCEKGESVEEVDGGSILTRGVKFTSAEEFLSFMEEDRSEGENGEEMVEQEVEDEESNLSRGQKFVSTSEKERVDDEDREKKGKQKMGKNGDRKRVKREKTREKTPVKTELVGHMKGVHLEENNYLCENEGYGEKFGRKSNLKAHVQNAHVRPHSCKEEECGKAFARKSDLVRHTRGVHLKDKNYICQKEGCGKIFGGNSNLKAHIRNVHQYVRIRKKGERKRVKKEKAGEKTLEKTDLNPVVRLKRLGEGSINVWTQKDVGKEQGAAEDGGNEEEVDGGIGGSILNRGVKFTSTEEFLSFLEEDRLDSENVFAEVERAGSLEKEGSEDSALSRSVEQSSGLLHDGAEFEERQEFSNPWSLRTVRDVGVVASGIALLNPVVRLKKLDIEAKLGSNCEPSQGRKPGRGGEVQDPGAEMV